MGDIYANSKNVLGYICAHLSQGCSRPEVWEWVLHPLSSSQKHSDEQIVFTIKRLRSPCRVHWGTFKFDYLKIASHSQITTRYYHYPGRWLGVSQALLDVSIVFYVNLIHFLSYPISWCKPHSSMLSMKAPGLMLKAVYSFSSFAWASSFWNSPMKFGWDRG